MDLNLLDFVMWVVMNLIFVVIEESGDGENYFMGCLFSILNIIYIMVFVYPIDLDWIDLFRGINIRL